MKENFGDIGSRISQRMKEMNFIQKDLSEKTGISKNAISNYINNLRIPKTLECYKISQALLVSMEWLLTGVEATKTTYTSNKVKEMAYLTEEQYKSILDKKGMNNEVLKSLYDEATEPFECTEREKHLILAFRTFDDFDKEMIEDTINVILKRLEKIDQKTSHTCNLGNENEDENAAAIDYEEHSIKKHA